MTRQQQTYLDTLMAWDRTDVDLVRAGISAETLRQIHVRTKQRLADLAEKWRAEPVPPVKVRP